MDGNNAIAGGWVRADPGYFHLMGRLGDKARFDLLCWVENFELAEETYWTARTGRLEKWFGLGVRLGSNEIYEADPICQRLQALGDRLYGPGWNSCLLYQYAAGMGLNPHRDQPVFADKVVVVNVGAGCCFRYGKQVYTCREGVVVAFNARVIHAIEPVREVRYSLSFRQVRAELKRSRLTSWESVRRRDRSHSFSTCISP